MVWHFYVVYIAYNCFNLQKCNFIWDSLHKIKIFWIQQNVGVKGSERFFCICFWTIKKTVKSNVGSDHTMHLCQTSSWLIAKLPNCPPTIDDIDTDIGRYWRCWKERSGWVGRQNHCEPSLCPFKNFYWKVVWMYFLTFDFSTRAALRCCTRSLNRQAGHYILQVVVLDNFCKFMYHMTFIAIGSYWITIFANCVTVSPTWGSHFGKFLSISGPFLALFVPF